MDEREVELQRARREGFIAGAKWGCGATGFAADEAALRYPITVRKPRVVRDGVYEIRVLSDQVQYRNVVEPDAQWFAIRAGTASVWRDLLAQPYEDVTE